MASLALFIRCSKRAAAGSVKSSSFMSAILSSSNVVWHSGYRGVHVLNIMSHNKIIIEQESIIGLLIVRDNLYYISGQGQATAGARK
jgi:hypothetical protein